MTRETITAGAALWSRDGAWQSRSQWLRPEQTLLIGMEYSLDAGFYAGGARLMAPGGELVDESPRFLLSGDILTDPYLAFLGTLYASTDRLSQLRLFP